MTGDTHVPVYHPKAGTAQVPASYLARARSKGWTEKTERPAPPPTAPAPARRPPDSDDA